MKEHVREKGLPLAGQCALDDRVCADGCRSQPAGTNLAVIHNFMADRTGLPLTPV